MYKHFFKRFIACLLSITGLIVFAIPMVIIAIAIKLDSKGPVFFRQERLGKGQKPFKIFKFRTMCDHAYEIGGIANRSDDPRITKVGAFLRRTSLDEIPQIFNVLAGQMSIIGPRAGDVESRDTYEEDEKDKLLVRPGITGFTQAYYRNGLGVREKRLYDAWYAHTVSFPLDVKIFLRTIKTVLMHENIYTND